MEKVYRAAKYIRTSCSDDELLYRDSAANQNKLIDAFVEVHPEITIVSEKIDNGYNGLFLDRPAFEELIAEIEEGSVNCVIVKDLSRISRSYIDVGRYLRDFFPAHSVRFISVDDHIDSIRLGGFEKTMALLKSIFNEQYSHDVSVKTRSCLDTKRRQGKYVGAVPIYGFQKSSDSKHQLVPDPNTVDVVQSIFHMKLQGMSAANIASVLNQANILSPLSHKRRHGLPHPTGGFADKNNARWSATTVLRILQDETYTGTLVQGRQRSFNYKTKTPMNMDESEWIRTENAHPAIISRADFDAVQRTLAIDTRTTPHSDRVHIFSGMLICGCCGGAMTRKTNRYNERQYVYYYCPTGKKNGCHDSSTLSEEDLVRTVTHKVKERITNIERLMAISKTRLEEAMRDECSRRISACDMKIQDLYRFRHHLQNSRASGYVNETEILSLQDYYDAEIARLNAELSALWQKIHTSAELIERNPEWEQDFLQFAHIQKLDRLAVVKMIQSICIHSKDKIDINFVYQSKYENLVRYSVLGGYAVGEKEPQAE